MDVTPADLKKWPTNYFSLIAIAPLRVGRCGRWASPNLAARLAQRDKTASSHAGVG